MGEKTILLTKIKPAVFARSGWFTRLVDESGDEYLTTECYPFAVGSTLTVTYDNGFEETAVMPEYTDASALWQAYYKKRRVTQVIPVMECLSEGQQEHYALYGKLRTLMYGADALCLLEQYSPDILIDKLEHDLFWFYSDVHGFAYDNFRRINERAEITTFEKRISQITCAAICSLRENERRGNTWMSFEDFYKSVSILLDTDMPDAPLLDALCNFEDRFYYDGWRVALQSTYEAEARICTQTRILLHMHPLSPEQVTFSAHLCEEQRLAVRGIVDTGNLSILTGKPGTGKTTAIADILRQYLGIKRIATLAPTGRAAARVWEALQEEFSADQLEGIVHCTIAKFLGQGAPSFLRAQSLKAAKDTDLLIVDETSMVDIFQLADLLDAIDVSHCKVILVGDKNQLPSIAAGNVLTDLIAAGVPTFHLEENHRSIRSIFDNAAIILSNSKDAFICDEHFQFLPPSALDDVLNRTDFSQMQTLFLTPYRSARYAGSTTAINEKLHRRYFGTNLVCVGGKVICTKNNYKAGYFNGEMGLITALAEDGVHITLGDTTVVARKEEIEDAYALTIHKAQGSEAEEVYIYLPQEASGNFLSKELLYTAVTRAKTKVTIIGNEATLREVMCVCANERRTFLSEFTVTE